MAVDDWFWWYENVKDQLPPGRQASVAVVDGLVIDAYTITMQWPESGSAIPVVYTMTFSL